MHPSFLVTLTFETVTIPNFKLLCVSVIFIFAKLNKSQNTYTSKPFWVLYDSQLDSKKP